MVTNTARGIPPYRYTIVKFYSNDGLQVSITVKCKDKNISDQNITSLYIYLMSQLMLEEKVLGSQDWGLNRFQSFLS